MPFVQQSQLSIQAASGIRLNDPRFKEVTEGLMQQDGEATMVQGTHEKFLEAKIDATNIGIPSPNSNSAASCSLF